jgi:hypothetical protein
MSIHKRPAPVAFTLGIMLVCAASAVAQLEAMDPAGDAGSSPADLRRCSAMPAQDSWTLTVETARPQAFANTQILLDTDRSAATGWHDGEHGFDVLIEGANRFAFQGVDQGAWRWQPTGEVRRTVLGQRLTLHLDRHVVGARCDLVVRTLDADYALVDRLPDRGAIQLDAAALDGTDRSEQIEPESAGDHAEAARDMIAVSVKQSAGSIVVKARTRGASDFANLLVFFDTDGSAATGYHSDAAPAGGFDVLLSGGRVLRFTGTTQTAWAWEGVADAARQGADARATARFAPALLDTRRAKAVFMMMSADWQTVCDRAPDRGAFDVQVAPVDHHKRKPAIQAAQPRANRADPPRQRFAAAQSFYCYYGSNQVAALSHYDILIAHAPQMQPADIARLQALGVVVVGYLSVGEDDRLRTANGTGPGGYASWYLDEDGDHQPDQNGIWKSYYANANDPAWRADRLTEARRLIREDGYDGIFLDTLDTASAFPQTEPGMIELVAGLRKALPDAPIVLNQGYPFLAKLAPFADGMMIESFTATYDFRKKEYVLHSPSSLDWTRGIAERVIRPAVTRHGLKVLVLDYAPVTETERIQMAADRAATFGFLFAAAPIHLDAVYPRGIAGEPDERWLRQQATPQSLRHVLTAAANGFPQGTVITPSSCYNGYRVAPVVDGISDRTPLYWSDAAWASAEDGHAAWLELRFPQALRGGRLRIHWAKDGGRLHASRAYRAEVERAGAWTTVDTVSANAAAITEHDLPDQPISAVRLVQQPGDGSAARPNLMWIAQIERVGLLAD